jgi:hypothetical protein
MFDQKRFAIQGYTGLNCNIQKKIKTAHQFLGLELTNTVSIICFTSVAETHHFQVAVALGKKIMPFRIRLLPKFSSGARAYAI